MTLSRRALFATLAPASPPRPNIVLIMVDDMAQRALSCYGNPHVQTPHIDSLARDGVRFTDFYVTPQCTPTRATLLTGQYTARNRMWHVIPRYGSPYARVAEPPYLESLPREAFTLAKGLKAAGYATACIGKWHLTVNADGNYNLLNQSAAAHYGFDVSAKPNVRPNEQATGDKGAGRLTDEAIAFIREHQGVRPYFLYLPHHTIHGKVSAPDDLIAKYRQRGAPDTGFQNATYLAALEHMDVCVGRLLAAVDRQNTIVLFLSDNGGVVENYDVAEQRMVVRERQFENPPLRAGKGSAYEGGIRVPLLIRWPGKARAGLVVRTPAHAVDLLPTLFALAGAQAPPGYVLDGVDLRPLLNGGRLPARALYWHMPFYDYRWAHTPAAAVRQGDWKLIEWFGDYIEPRAGAAYQVGGRVELYHLGRDPGEKHDQAAREPARVRQMRAALHAWIQSCGQSIPGPNPNFDPARPLEERRG